MDLCETRIIGPNTREWIIAGESQEALRKHHIVETGLSDAAPPYRMVRPAPPDMHLLICIAGEGRVLVEGEWQVCGPGQAYLSPAGEPMAFHAIPKKRWIFGWIYYATPAAERLFPQPGSILRDADPTLFETSFRGLHREVQSHGDESVVGAWTHLLHTACLRLLKPPAARFRLQSLWREVEGHPSHPWSMAQLAQRAGLSAEQLRRVAWEETGRSPMKHVAFLRLQKAMLLLRTSQLKVAAIAETVGYKDPFAFSTAFKRHLGCSPSAYGARRDRRSAAG